MTVAGIGHNGFGRRPPVYAITLDLDIETLEKLYPSESWRNADTDIRKFLEDIGFHDGLEAGAWNAAVVRGQNPFMVNERCRAPIKCVGSRQGAVRRVSVKRMT